MASKRKRIDAAGRLRMITLLATTVFCAACEESIDRTVEVPSPTLALVQSGQGTVDLEIAGSFALRGLQGDLVYDATTARLTAVEAGEDAERLDRVFWADPAQANGRLVVGLSDTRRVMLPARGKLLRFQLQKMGGGDRTTLSFDNLIGAIDGGERVELSSTSVEVTLP